MGDEAGQRGVLLRLVWLTGDEIKSLADAMFAVPVVRSPNGRQQVLEFVKERNPAFNPHRSELLALKPGTVIGPDQLPVGMQKAIYGHTGNGDCGLKPANVRWGKV